MARKLQADELRWTCPTEDCLFEHTGDIESLPEMIGQGRALRALDFGVGIKSPGFNIFAVGPTGTGRMTAIKTILEREVAGIPPPDDWLYVYNFDNPNHPKAIRVCPGNALALKADMTEVIRDLRSEIPNAFDDETYERQKNGIIEALRKQESDDFATLAQEARSQSLGLQRTPQGILIIPLLEDGQPMTPDHYNGLPEEQRRQIEEKRLNLETRFNEIVRNVVRVGKEVKLKLQDLDVQIARSVVKPHLEVLKEVYSSFSDALAYLTAVEEDIVHNAQDFRVDPDQQKTPGPFGVTQDSNPFLRYEVNVLVDNSKQQSAPVILEPNGTYFNLMGRIEHQAQFGALITDFTMIKSGALHKANGGYLVIEARDVLTSLYTYDALKKSLENNEIRLEEPGEQFRTIAIVSIEPEPIPLNVKVVMIGSAYIYHLLAAYDEDFRTLFKVKADFAVDMPRTSESMGHFGAFIAQRCRDENLLHFDRSAVVKVVEYGVRLSGDQTRLTTRFMDIADLTREASYWASRNEHLLVTGEDVQQAIAEKTYRVNLIDERMQEMIADGTLMVDVTGAVVGQINGLAVIGLGDYTFGKPSRITVRTYTGQAGIVNIEREAKLSGRIHDKGVLILTGYLGGQYAGTASLSLSASIAFEQLYDGVDGDSASSTELYALLSSLADTPIKQQYAVTGSVNQRGEIQPIGGVTHKIEGYYDVCKAIGFTGEQGVLIPKQNVKNLMLREDIVEAARQGQFHVFAVSTIDEGIELLTGIPAGERGADGRFPKDTIHARVERRLDEIRKSLKRSGKTERDDEPESAPEGTGDDSPQRTRKVTGE